MNFLKSALIALLLGSGTLLAGEDFREFTGSNGKVIRAKILSFAGELVKIELANGRTVKSDITVFSEKDQAWIRKWAEDNFWAQDVIHIKTTEARKDRETRYKGLMYTDGVFREKAIKIKEEKGFYKILIKNTTDQFVKDLKVDYLVCKHTGQMRGDKHDGQLQAKAYSFKIEKIGPKGEHEAVSEYALLTQTELKKGYFTGGGDEESKDDLVGIWIRIFKDGKLVAEEISSQKLTKVGWDELLENPYSNEQAL